MKFDVKLKVHVHYRMAERFGLVSQIYGFNKVLLLEHFSFNLLDPELFFFSVSTPCI